MTYLYVSSEDDQYSDFTGVKLAELVKSIKRISLAGN